MPRGLVPHVLEPPRGGVVSDLVELEIPPGALRQSQNMLPRFGRLMTRPGLVRALQTGPGGRIIGGVTYRAANSVGRVVAATPTKWFRKDATVWTDITPGAPLTATADDHARFAVFPTGTPQVNLLIGVNNRDTPKKWDGVTAAFAPLGGAPPVARDVAVTDQYVILVNVVEGGNRFTIRGRISKANDPETWPDNFVFELPMGGVQGADEIVAARALSRTAVGILKDESQWVGITQPGAFPFRFERVDTKPGPVSTAAVAEHGGVLYYLGRDVRLYRFDGARTEAISPHLDRQFQALFRGVSRGRAWALPRRADRSIWFFFPSGAEDPDRALSYHLETGAIYPHVFAQKLSAGWPGDDVATVAWDDLAPFTWANLADTFPTWESFGGSLVPIDYLGTVDGNVFRFQYDFDDDGVPISMLWEYPLRAPVSQRHRHRVDALEASFTAKPGGPAVSVSVGTSEALAAEPTYTPLGTHDTAATGRQLLTKDGLDGRFLSQKFEATTLNKVGVEYQGALLYLWAEEVA
jgi:hypothetical protein